MGGACLIGGSMSRRSRPERAGTESALIRSLRCARYGSWRLVDDAAARARVGSVLNDKWMLEELLGVGGMGAVYAARHTRNGARAAVKVLHPDLAREKDIRERFLREGRAANAVQHSGVVKV